MQLSGKGLAKEKISTHPLLPHQPYLEDIIQSSTLDALVPRVIRDIIVHFVLLEEVVSLGGEAGSKLVLSFEEDGRTLQRDTHHFVGVPGHRVRPIVCVCERERERESIWACCLMQHACTCVFITFQHMNTSHQTAPPPPHKQNKSITSQCQLIVSYESLKVVPLLQMHPKYNTEQLKATIMPSSPALQYCCCKHTTIQRFNRYRLSPSILTVLHSIYMPEGESRFQKAKRATNKTNIKESLILSPPVRGHLTSTWSQMECFSQTAAILSIGSNAPRTVVPAVAITANDTNP